MSFLEYCVSWVSDKIMRVIDATTPFVWVSLLSGNSKEMPLLSKKRWIYHLATLTFFHYIRFSSQSIFPTLYVRQISNLHQSYIYIYIYIYNIYIIYVIHDIQSAQISHKQDGRNIQCALQVSRLHKIMSLQWPCSNSYTWAHDPRFLTTHHVPKCMSIFTYIWSVRRRFVRIEI